MEGFEIKKPLAKKEMKYIQYHHYIAQSLIMCADRIACHVYDIPNITHINTNAELEMKYDDHRIDATGKEQFKLVDWCKSSNIPAIFFDSITDKTIQIGRYERHLFDSRLGVCKEFRFRRFI
eukprot:731697_1